MRHPPSLLCSFGGTGPPSLLRRFGGTGPRSLLRRFGGTGPPSPLRNFAGAPPRSVARRLGLVGLPLLSRGEDGPVSPKPRSGEGGNITRLIAQRNAASVLPLPVGA